MNTPLLLLVLTNWGVVAAQESRYCMDQPAGMEAAAGEAVTLPCWYSYPRELGPIGGVITIWKTGQGDRCGDNIYFPTRNQTHLNYTNRLSLVGDPEGDQTLSIQITDLRVSDSKRYCCRVQILKPNSTELLQRWESHQGTLLTVRENTRLHGYQPDSIPAMERDSITIPCKYTYTKSLLSTQNVIIEWSIGEGLDCGNQFIQPLNEARAGQDETRIFLEENLNDNQPASLRIHHLRTTDSKRYCCRVRIKEQQDQQLEWTRPYGTRLIVGGQSNPPGYNVEQPDKASAQEGETVTISCSFTHPQDEEEPFWIGVYWRVKLELKEFIYHTDPELIHASYRGRTQQSEDKGRMGARTLTLHNVTRSDNQTFYCLVEFRFCKTGINNIVPIVKEGNGTKLRVKGLRLEKENLSLMLIVRVVLTLAVIIIASAAIFFLFLQKKG